MNPKLSAASSVGQSTSVARSTPERSTAVDRSTPERATAVDQKLTLLRQVIDRLNWTLDALASEMGYDKSYISRVLNGEKPLTLLFEVALPDDVETAWDRAKTEASGSIVVEPVDDATAERYLAIALFSKLSRPALPAKTAGPIKADLQPNKKASIA